MKAEDISNPLIAEIATYRTDFGAAIASIDAAFRRLLESGLNERAIVALIYDSMSSDNRGQKVAGKPAIRAVLRGLGDLRKTYCNAEGGDE